MGRGEANERAVVIVWDLECEEDEKRGAVKLKGEIKLRGKLALLLQSYAWKSINRQTNDMGVGLPAVKWICGLIKFDKSNWSAGCSCFCAYSFLPSFKPFFRYL